MNGRPVGRRRRRWFMGSDVALGTSQSSCSAAELFTRHSTRQQARRERQNRHENATSFQESGFHVHIHVHIHSPSKPLPSSFQPPNQAKTNQARRYRDDMNKRSLPPDPRSQDPRPCPPSISNASLKPQTQIPMFDPSHRRAKPSRPNENKHSHSSIHPPTHPSSRHVVQHRETRNSQRQRSRPRVSKSLSVVPPFRVTSKRPSAHPSVRSHPSRAMRPCRRRIE